MCNQNEIKFMLNYGYRMLDTFRYRLAMKYVTKTTKNLDFIKKNYMQTHKMDYMFFANVIKTHIGA